MNQQPDKLFRDKLEGHYKPAPAGAWNRIEARLDKKNNKGLWLKIAASLLAVAVAAALLWRAQPTDNITPVADKTQPKNVLPKEKPATETIQREDQPEPVADIEAQKPEEQARENKQAVRRNDAVTPRRQTPARETQEETLLADNPSRVNTQSLTVVEEETFTIEEPVAVEQETAVATVSTPDGSDEKEENGVTLVYSAAEVNEKYLNKKSLAEATSQEKKPSTLRKLLDKAYDLKNNQDPFGDLRQKKNEILALNFKNDKQRSPNK